jgi:hypothetical protein
LKSYFFADFFFIGFKSTWLSSSVPAYPRTDAYKVDGLRMIIDYKSSSSFAPHFLKVRLETFLHIKRPGGFQSQNIITCGKAVADEKVTLRDNIRM